MAILVYVTESCRDDARRHGISEIVDRLCTEVEERQSLAQFDPFPPPYLVKKKLHGRQNRLVAEARNVGDHTVVIFLAVMIRGSRDYEEEFSKDPIAYGTKHLVGLVEEATLQSFVDGRTSAGYTPGKPEPSPAEYQLLYDAFAHQGSGILSGEGGKPGRIVCESHEWVRQVAHEAIQSQLNRLAEPCLNALSAESGLHYFKCKEKEGWGVWAFADDGHVLLLSVADSKNAVHAKEIASKIAGQIMEEGDGSLLRHSRRAYPAIVLADEDLWLNLEREQVANMALSPEETEVLESARYSDNPFPLFINGRAGSGKSTILQYLFADLVFAHWSLQGESDPTSGEGIPGAPLYLTASGDLLRNARAFVERLLISEAMFATSSRRPSKQELGHTLDNSFREFLPFMLSLVPPLEQRTKFSRSRRIDYPEFRSKWERRFGKDPRARKEHGPDVSWHVIRSYIKGMGSDEYLTPEDYEQLPENQLTVTPELFKTVFEQVWGRWYAELLEEGHWDDQDLARYILDHDLAPRSYGGVFCDEAQDFTRIELEVLLRLNVYSNRALPMDAVTRVPFAFAGDEFQTLNPTGFRWDSIKASFVEKFIFELNPSRRGERADLNYRELRYNYRSTKHIVRFCNVVQALRAYWFDISELRPQRPWTTQADAAPVLFFKSDDGEFWNAFREHASGYVILVPCNEGEEASYVESDPYLRDRVPVDNGVPRNVLSAGRAKGCEYPAVVVYGFGDSLKEDLVGAIGQQPHNTPATKQSLALQYFLNRVYVAVSRPKKRLVVVDTQDGLNHLWKVASNDAARERLVGALRRGGDAWLSETEIISAGRPRDLAGDFVPDRAENARSFEDEGRANRDSYLMYQAFNSYKEAGDISKARECRAHALDYEERPLEAGEAYSECGFFDDAVRCLWRAEKQGWLKLLELANDHPELMGRLELQWARALQAGVDSKGVLEVLNRFLDRLENDDRFAQATYADGVWNAALEPLVARALEGDVPILLAKGLSEAIQRLHEIGFSIPARLQAEVCFAAQQFARAVQLWESIGERRLDRYHRSKAGLVGFPENLEFLDRVGDLDQIIRDFDLTGRYDFLKPQAQIVCKALIRARRFSEVLKVARESKVPDLMLLAAISFHGSGEVEKANEVLSETLRLQVETGDWDAVSRFCENGEVGAAEDWRTNKGTREWVRSQNESLKVVLVRSLARSPLFPSAGDKYLRSISKFLREYLRVKDGKWKGKISYFEAGAAHERSGRLTDSIQFYEAVLSERLGSDVAAGIRERWLAVKARQLQFERDRRASREVIKRIEAEIQSRIQSWRMSRPKDIAEYPEVPSYGELGDEVAIGSSPTPVLRTLAQAVAGIGESPAASAPPIAPMASPRPIVIKDGADAKARPSTQVGERAPSATLQIGSVRIELSRTKGICLMTNSDTLDTVRVEWGARKVSGTMDVEKRDDLWEIPAWRFWLKLPEDGENAVQVSSFDEGVVVWLQA